MSALLAQAISHIKAGQAARGRELLAGYLQDHPKDENAWLLMSRCVTNLEQQKQCFERVLRINPQNALALEGLKRIAQYGHSGRRAASERPGSTPKRVLDSRVVIVAICATAVLLCIGALVGFQMMRASSPFVAVPSQSPEESYARSMEPVLAKVYAWMNGPVAQYDLALASPYGHGAAGETSNEATLFLVSINGDFAMGGSVSERQVTMNGLLENLGPSLSAISADGFDVVSDLGGIDAPGAIRVAHEQATACVHYKVDAANSIIKWLSEGTAAPALGDDKCSLMAVALDRIASYVRANK